MRSPAEHVIRPELPDVRHADRAQVDLPAAASRPRRGGVGQLPNVVTLARLALLAPLMVGLAIADGTTRPMGVVMLLAGLTDFLDGQLARRLHLESELGRILDPVADRVFGLSAYLAALVTQSVPTAIVVALLARDIAALIGSVVIGRRRLTALRARWTGKAATALVYAGLSGAFIVGAPGGRTAATVVLLPATALYFLSLYQYFLDASSAQVHDPSGRSRR